ncbi:MAG: iron ABC transporter substrate-binding protein [Actinomycetota bacterium]|nr:iron ABC transporter substrate-binding protein [Actinomycetota bacterium]
MDRHRNPLRLMLLFLAFALAAASCSDDDAGGTLTIYSGRNEELVGSLIDQFETETGIAVEVRYASSTDLAATLREEGTNSPADVFFAQDPASLGAVAEAGLFRTLPGDLLELVPAQFSDRDGLWIGVSGRSRVVVYDSTRISPSDLPDSVDGFTDPTWQGRIAIAPSNGSFLAFVAAMILERGEDATRDWLEGIAANDPQTFSGNSPIVAAVNDGTVDVGLVNHYYLLGLRAEVGETNAANHFFATAGPGSLVMPAGVGILATTDHGAEAERFVEFLLSPTAQQYFVTETFEYPVIEGVEPDPILPPLASLAQPDIDLSDLATALDRATDLVAEAGLL